MRLRRYALGARWYDVLSGERWVYRRPRLRAIDRLALQAGDRVLDVGCGTGLNFAPLTGHVGRRGSVTGVDLSRAMLDVARRRVTACGWPNVEVVRGDAGDLCALVADRAPFDAVLFTYSLSIVERWQDAWAQALSLLRVGGRVAVVDMALPRGRWRWLWPVARLACWTGGADPYRAPWRVVPRDTLGATADVLRGGHVHVAVGEKA